MKITEILESIDISIKISKIYDNIPMLKDVMNEIKNLKDEMFDVFHPDIWYQAHTILDDSITAVSNLADEVSATDPHKLDEMETIKSGIIDMRKRILGSSDSPPPPNIRPEL